VFACRAISGEALSALRNGETYKLGYCLGKLPSTPLLDRLSELFLGYAQDWKIDMVHKAHHRPITDAQKAKDAVLVRKIETSDEPKQYRRIEGAGANSRRAFRALKKYRLGVHCAHCAHCNKDIPPSNRGRPKLYCSPRCRKKAEMERRSKGE
jgi:hypothetical protein